MNYKLKDFLRNYVGYLTVALVSLIYIATAFITIKETQKTISRIIADGVMSFLMGILINRIFDTQGILNGEREEKVILTTKLHGEVVDRCTPYMDKLDSWCDIKNKNAMERARKYYLYARGIKYQTIFDDDGTILPMNVPKGLGFIQSMLYKYRRWRALHLHITQISSGILIGDNGKIEDPFFMGRSKHEYMKNTTRKDVFSKLITAILFGYYGVSLIQNFDWSTLIWTILQVVIFIAMGVIKMQQSFIYVTDEYRGRIIKKIDILQLFEIEIKNEPKQEECNNEGCEESK